MKDKFSTDKKGKGSKKKPPKKRSKSLGKRIFFVVALLMVMLMAGAFLKYLFFGESKRMNLSEVQHLYAYEVVIPEEVEEVAIFEGADASSDIYQGQRAYEEEQLALAIKHFNKAISLNPKRFDIKLYAALTHLKLGKDDQAQQLLYQIIEHPDKSLYANEALWYSALVDLKNNNITACKESLGKLVALKTTKRELLEKATDLQGMLERVGE